MAKSESICTQKLSTVPATTEIMLSTIRGQFNFSGKLVQKVINEYHVSRAIRIILKVT